MRSDSFFYALCDWEYKVEATGAECVISIRVGDDRWEELKVLPNRREAEIFVDALYTLGAECHE